MNICRRVADMAREAAIGCLYVALKGLICTRWLLLARCVYPVYSHLILHRSPAQVARLERRRGLTP